MAVSETVTRARTIIVRVFVVFGDLIVRDLIRVELIAHVVEDADLAIIDVYGVDEDVDQALAVGGIVRIAVGEGRDPGGHGGAPGGGYHHHKERPGFQAQSGHRLHAGGVYRPSVKDGLLYGKLFLLRRLGRGGALRHGPKQKNAIFNGRI